jgi:EmrB/QacA subfamily drug resistance transporter
MRTIALIVVAAAFVMDIVDLTIVNVALPTLQRTLGAGDGAVQWIVAGYATVFAVLLAVGGRLGDIYGYRRMLMIGMAGFSLASLGCGLAPGVKVLIAARLVQAVAAATMLPQIMSIVQRLFLPHERVSALGVFGVLGGTAAVLGPVLGGLIIGGDFFGLGWRPIFLVNVPIGLVLLPIAGRLLPAGRSAHAPVLDIGGVLLIIATAFSLVFPIIQGRALGWPIWCWPLMALSLPFGCLLAVHSRRRIARGQDTLFVPSLLRLHGFALGLAVSMIFQMAIASLLFTLSLTLQNGLGFTPARAALAHIPYALGSTLAIGYLARRLVPRFGARIIIWGGVVMMAGCAALGLELTLLAPGTISVAQLAVPMLLFGIGMGLVGGPLSPIALADVDIALAGAASGLLKTVQEMGGAIGVALIGGLYFALDGSGPERGELFVLAVVAACLATCCLLATRMRMSFGAPALDG